MVYLIFDAEGTGHDVRVMGVCSPAWQEPALKDQARISELVADLVQALPEEAGKPAGGQAGQ